MIEKIPQLPSWLKSQKYMHQDREVEESVEPTPISMEIDGKQNIHHEIHSNIRGIEEGIEKSKAEIQKLKKVDRCLDDIEGKINTLKKEYGIKKFTAKLEMCCGISLSLTFHYDKKEDDKVEMVNESVKKGFEGYRSYGYASSEWARIEVFF